MKEIINQHVEKLVEMVKGARICMLITIEEKGENLSGRPMSISEIEEDGTMWFFSKASSSKADEVEKERKVAISITDESRHNYLMINGTATLVNDKVKMIELWSSIMKVWFPLGLDDPDMILIRVTPEEVDYWDSSSNNMLVLFKMLKAIVTGKEYAGGEHGKINL